MHPLSLVPRCRFLLCGAATLWLALAAPALSAPSTHLEGGGGAEPPARWDVLFLAVDDLRDWIGCLHTYPGVQTPNIDRLAARGTLFRHAYCAAPLCNPSRAALLTGIPPQVSGVYDNDQDWRLHTRGAVSLPRYFRANGWEVLGAGKIFHDQYNDEAAFDEYFHGGTSASPRPENRPLSGVELSSKFDWGPVHTGMRGMRDGNVAAWAAKKLGAARAEPLFLAAGIYRPHLPWYVPKEFFDLYPLDEIHRPAVKEDDLDDLPPLGRAAAGAHIHQGIVAAGVWEKAIQGYLASISFADRCIGQILDALDASGRADHTIVVLWSDHGWHLGEKSHWRKFVLWEEATRVPLVIVAPGLTEPGSVCDRAVSLMDLYPTLVELCGLPEREGIAGASLVPLLHDPAAEWTRPALTVGGENEFAVRTERWRLIVYADGTRELYDHDADPHEWTNLAGREEWAAVEEGLMHSIPSTCATDTGRDSRKSVHGADGDAGD